MLLSIDGYRAWGRERRLTVVGESCTPDLGGFLAQAAQHRIVTVSMELVADTLTPVGVFMGRVLARVGRRWRAVGSVLVRGSSAVAGVLVRSGRSGCRGAARAGTLAC